MSAHDWQKVEELLHQAMALEPEQRAAFLDVACGSDAELRAELNSLLLVGDDLSDGFLNSPLRGVLDGQIGEIDSASALVAGQIFAQRFELIRKLGEGGMGQVWLAEQTSPVRRQVAVKLIKAGMYDEAVVQRFQSERQSLAIMDHPAIAKVFDAGTTPQGQPYLVMEYVPGLPITDYCDQHKLKIKDRLELFIQACEGVQHAHQKAIIHRDLKPSNILVIEVDGKAVPRIIDFGLAKTTGPQVSGESPFTQLGQFIGTPGYMSPEQVSLSARDIDTRTDVYTLGVVLYVLLTGLQPFETKRREKPSLEEWLRQLREEEPPNPSTKVSGDKDTSSATAEARGTEARQLVSQLRGDLDWITMKALERDRTRRYATPSELAADLRRYLNDEPVTARPASAGYRLRKYTRRHRVAMSVGAGLLLVLAVFSAIQALQLRETTRERDHAKLERDRANQERDRANQERDRAARITDFMIKMFRVSDPSEARGNSVTAREILDKASTEIDKGLAQDPEVQSQMMAVMAWVYETLELHHRAHELAQRALGSRLSLHGADDRQTLESMTQLGSILKNEGHFADAEKLERQALASERRVLGPQNRQTLETTDELATILEEQDRYDEAEKLEREVIEVAIRTLGPESDLTRRSMTQLGSTLQREGRYEEGKQLYGQVLDIDRRVLGPEHPETLAALGNFGVPKSSTATDAAKFDRELLATMRRELGPEHPNILGAMINLANVLRPRGELAEAEKLMRDALALIRRRNLGSDYPNMYAVQGTLVQVLIDENRLREAQQMNQEMLNSLSAGNPNILLGRFFQVSILIKEGKYTEAEALARRTLEVEQSTDLRLMMTQVLGLALAHKHRYGEASTLLRDEIDNETNSERRMMEWYMFASVAAVAGHADDAIKYLKEAVKLGYKDVDAMMAEDDLKSLRTNPEFRQIVAGIKKPLAVNRLQSSEPSKVPSSLRERDGDSQGQNSPFKLDTKIVAVLNSGAVPSPPFIFNPSTSLTPELQSIMKKELTAFLSHMYTLGIPHWVGGQIRVSVAPGIHFDGNWVARWEKASSSVVIASAFASDQATVLRQAAQLLLSVREIPSDDYKAIKSGLANYFPCSFLNNPRRGDGATPEGQAFNPPTDLRNQRQLAEIPTSNPRAVERVGGEIWGGVFWELRGILGVSLADRLLADTWIAFDPATGQDRPIPKAFAQRLLQTIQSARASTEQLERARTVFAKRGLTL